MHHHQQRNRFLRLSDLCLRTWRTIRRARDNPRLRKEGKREKEKVHLLKKRCAAGAAATSLSLIFKPCKEGKRELFSCWERLSCEAFQPLGETLQRLTRRTFLLQRGKRHGVGIQEMSVDSCL